MYFDELRILKVVCRTISLVSNHFKGSCHRYYSRLQLLITKTLYIQASGEVIKINRYIESKSESNKYKTTSEQQKRIDEAIVQISRGESFTNEQVEKEIDKWLKEK